MCKAHVEVAILAHRHLRRHTRFSSSGNDHQHAAHNREDSHRRTQAADTQTDRRNDPGED
jgi:hypothetical protein